MKITANDFLEYIKAKNNIDIETIKSFFEPVFLQEGYREENVSEIKYILIVRLDEIGDNVLSSGFIREVRRNYPKAHITLVVNAAVAPLMELCPYANEVIGFKFSHNAPTISSFEETFDFCRGNIWKIPYDIAFLPRWDTDYTPAPFLAYFSGAKERIGYSARVSQIRTEIQPYIDALLTTTVINPSHISHEAAKNFYLLKAINLRVEDDSAELWYDIRDYNSVKKTIKEFSKGRKIIAVGVGSNLRHKVYPPEKLLVALNKIKREDNCFILFGGKAETEIGKFLCENLSNAAVDLTGKTSLRETAAALSFCSIYIGMDTGVMHIAAALKLPVAEINCAPMTLTDSPLLTLTKFLPWQTPYIVIRPTKALPPCDQIYPLPGCSKLEESHCISQIVPDEIVKAYEKLTAVKVCGFGTSSSYNRRLAL